MPYEYLDDEAIADIAFIAKAETLDLLFTDACMAVYKLQTDVNLLSDELDKPIEVEEKTIDRLLYKVLDEIIFLKDAYLFFPKSVDIRVEQTKNTFKAQGRFLGCTFDHNKYPMGNDIKAITMHDFYVKSTNSGWEAYVLVDI